MHFSAAVFGFAAACLVALVLTPILRRVATRRGLMESTDHRRVHQDPRPNVGGVAMLVAWVAAMGSVALGFAALPPGFFGLFAALTSAACLVALVGLIDDVRGCRPFTKLLVQIVAVGLLQLQLDVLGVAVTSPLGLTTLLVGGVLSVIWMLGITNAMNLIDGLDGLAAGIAVISGIGFIALGWSLEQPTLSLVAAAVVGAALGFLRSNLHPSKIFMGDTGSLFLGFLMAGLGALLFWAKPTVATGLGLLLVIWVPSLDTIYAVIRRSVAGRSIFAADRGHLHHRLLDAGLSHRVASLALWGLSTLSTVAGVQVALGRSVWAWAGAVLLATLPLAWVLSLRPVPTARALAPQRPTAAVSQNRAA